MLFSRVGVWMSEWVRVTTESEPTTNSADFDPIFPDFRDFPGDGVSFKVCQHSWLWCQDSQLPTAYLRRCENLACCENSWVKFIFFKSSFDSWNWGHVVVQLFHRFLSLYARGKRGPFRSETHFEILSCEAPLCLRVGIPLLHHFCNPTLLAWMVQFDSQGSR